jgi:hypothetical protein
MRGVFLLPFPVVVAVVAGCGSEVREQAALSVPQRDLTLPAQVPEVEIASPVELQAIRAQQQTVRPSRRARRPASAPRPSSIEPKPTPKALAAAPVLTLPTFDSVAKPASTAAEPANDRELPPGKTVTLIPASSGPSTASEGDDEFPTARGGTIGLGGGRGGGPCPPRGPGRGIAGPGRGIGGPGRGIGITAFPRPHWP